MEEAVGIFSHLCSLGKEAIYYAGGTEIISMARMNQMRFQAVIDIKGIPDCSSLRGGDGSIMIGAAVPLNQICESGLFPFLAGVAKRAADHTSRNRISLGGNICSLLPYREMVLAVEAVGHKIITIEGLRDVPVQLAFLDRFALQCGFCTPGFIMNCHALVNIHPDANEETIKEWLQSNICRCTGYKEIMEAVKTVLSQRA